MNRILRQSEWLVFGLGLSLYLWGQTGLVLSSVLDRAIPAEPDDAYSYLVKATQMAHACFLQDCPALKDLRPQLLAFGQANWFQLRQYNNIFVIYHPLHSVILVGLHSLGLSWEAAYNVVCVAGSLFIGLMIGYWLVTLWGPGAAGTALASLVFVVFPDQGLNYIVPSNLALGLAFGLWARVNQSPRIQAKLLVMGIVALVAMHPIGRVYAAGTLLLYLGQEEQLRDPKTWLIVGLGLAMIALPSVLPLVVSHPDLSMGPYYPRSEYQKQGIGENLMAATGIIKAWEQYYGGWVVIGCLILGGLPWSVDSRCRRNRLLTGALLLMLLLATLLYVVPLYKGEIFKRVWVSAAVFLSGLMGHTLWVWLKAIWQEMQVALNSARRPQARAFGRTALWLGLAILVLGSGCWVGKQIVTVDVTLQQKKLGRMLRKSYVFDPSQPELLAQQAAKCGSVVYNDNETLLYYFLTHETLNCGATFAPVLPKHSLLRQKWLINNLTIQYLVTLNPLDKQGLTKNASLVLGKGDFLTIGTTIAQPLKPALYLENRGGEALLQLQLFEPLQVGQPTKHLLLIPASWEGWLPSYFPSTMGGNLLKITVMRSDSPIYLQGIRNNPTSHLYWPWDSGLKITYKPLGSKKTSKIGFETKDFANLVKRPVAIIADKGSSVLMKVNPLR